MANPGEDFQTLSTTISSIYDLRGIGVQAVYVSSDLWQWMREMEDRTTLHLSYWVPGEQYYQEAEVKWKTRYGGSSSCTIKPYGADHNIPVKIKYSGKQPWKIVVTYRKE